MLCKVCSDVLLGIWDPAKTPRVCRLEDFSRRGDFTSPNRIEPENPNHPENYVFGHHITQESFKQSAHDNCIVCSRFKWTQRQGQDPRFTALGLKYYSVVEFDYLMGISMVFSTVDRYMLQETLRPARNPAIDFSPNTSGTSIWTLTHSWLATCLQSHNDCNKREDKDFIPPYLLRLNEALKSFHLVDAKEVESGTRYITLTHCYPYDDASLKLSSSLIENISSQQPLSTLPQTYRDAFTIVTQLGLTHLWIDHLCLVQDSQTDKSLYENKMIRRKILSNSFCGIGATGSISPSSGLFVNRDLGLLKPFTFKFPVDFNRMVSFKFAKAERDEGKIKPFDIEPLHQSARAMHDRLLVPRMIHFTSQMVYWECHGMHCDEFGPITKDENYFCDVGTEGEMTYKGAPVSKMWKPLIKVLYNQEHNNPIDQIYYRWLCFIEDYSRLQVVSEEKLPLLENFVGEIKDLLHREGCGDTEYLFGMWRSLLPITLPWIARGYSKRRSTAAHIPTWSWASVRSIGIRHVMKTAAWNKTILCELVNVTRALDGAGVLTTSSLLLKGKFFIGRMAPSPLRSGPSTETRIISLTDYDFPLKPPMERIPYNMMWTGTFDTEEDIAEEVFCLPVTLHVFCGSDCVKLPLKYYIEGLMLSRLEDGRYVRRGRWTIDRNSQEECLDAVRQLQDHVLEII